jgi:phosphatidylserine/phosphatidylglycerophosphate/cardiolipin synthase-like enzyme
LSVAQCGGVLAALVGAAAVAATATAPVAQAAGPVYYRLVQYPEAGLSGLYTQIDDAKRSIDMEMYELNDQSAEQDMAKAAKRGVKVRVLLDRDYSGAHVNGAAYTYLHGQGVQVRWAPQDYIFHIKATSFDGRTSDVSTGNLTAEYYSSTRDAMVVDSDPVQVKAIEQTFANDWRAAPWGAPRSQTVQAPGLVWSPNTQTGSAEAAMVAQIAGAHHVVDFESEELSDAPVYEALAAAARRGVSCRIVMTASSEWDAALAALTRAGCRVHVFQDSSDRLYIHEKLVLDDPGTARESLLIGSQNASWSSLHENRELSLLIRGANGGSAVIADVNTAFRSDYASASSRH